MSELMPDTPLSLPEDLDGGLLRRESEPLLEVEPMGRLENLAKGPVFSGIPDLPVVFRFQR